MANAWRLGASPIAREENMPRLRSPRRGIPKSIKCEYVHCRCSVEKENYYRSEYCEQAAGQRPEREYCQMRTRMCAASIDSGGTIWFRTNQRPNTSVESAREVMRGGDDANENRIGRCCRVPRLL